MAVVVTEESARNFGQHTAERQQIPPCAEHGNSRPRGQPLSTVLSAWMFPCSKLPSAVAGLVFLTCAEIQYPLAKTQLFLATF